MRIASVCIENFRGIKHLDLDLGEVTVLIGENNSGKTSVLDALRLCLRDLGPRRSVIFDALDFHLPDADAEPSSADPIRIEIAFSEQETGEWGDTLTGSLSRSRILQVDDRGRGHVILRVTCAYNPNRRDFASDWAFLNLARAPLAGIGDRALAMLQRDVLYYYLPALRDVKYHFGEKGPFWRSFLKDSELPPEKKAEIETRLREVNELVTASHAGFKHAEKELRRVQDAIPLAAGDVVSVEAVPGRIFDTLANARIYLGAENGAKIPVKRHGEGTQSLAVLMLFAAFLKAEPEGSPVIALEEPEAHLHPSAIRALWRLVNVFSGQKLISTHSGDLLAEVDVHHVRRLARTPQGIKSFRVPDGLLCEKEKRKFKSHLRHANGDILFARCWLLVEGETESWIYPAAARALGKDLHHEGVRVVEYRQSDVGLLAKIANELGIVWYCVGDDDSEGQKTAKAVRKNLGAAGEADRLILPYRDMETHLLSNGYDGVYDQLMGDQDWDRIERVKGDPDYWCEYAENFPKGRKTAAAAAAAAELERRGEQGVTAEIRGVLNKAVSLARGA